MFYKCSFQTCDGQIATADFVSLAMTEPKTDAIIAFPSEDGRQYLSNSKERRVLSAGRSARLLSAATASRIPVSYRRGAEKANRTF